MSIRHLLRAFALVLLALAAAACRLEAPAGDPLPAGVYSWSDLTGSLDALLPAARSLSLPGASVFQLPGGALMKYLDFAAYLGAIKSAVGGAAFSASGGHPFPVVPRKLSLPRNGSGLMWVPYGAGPLSVPVISLQHGTQVYRYCAPSQFSPSPASAFASPDPTGAIQNYVECIVGGLMASAGYIVVMPDYPGFGDSAAAHPYVQASLGDAVRDAVAAASAVLSNATVHPNGEVFLTGYSEGGYATMEGARSLQQAGVPVAATVPCDGPYDLSGTMLAQMTSGQPIKVPSYLPYTASGYKAAYPAVLDYGTLLSPAWADLMTRRNPFDGTHTTAEVAALVPASTVPLSMLSASAPGSLLVPGGSVYDLLALNDGWVGWTPASPVVMVHCPTDDVVPYGNATAARDAFAAEGVPAALVSIVDVSPLAITVALEGSSHVAAYPRAMAAAFSAIQAVRKSFPG